MKVRNIKRNYKEKSRVEDRQESDSSSPSDDSDNEVVMNRRGVIPREWF